MKKPKPKAPPFQSNTKYIRVTDAKEMRRLVTALMWRAPWYMIIREVKVPSNGKALVAWEIQFPASVDMQMLALSFNFEETGK